MCADALLGRRHKVEAKHPLVQRNLAALQDGANGRSERLVALPVIALMEPLAVALAFKF